MGGWNTTAEQSFQCTVSFIFYLKKIISIKIKININTAGKKGFHLKNWRNKNHQKVGLFLFYSLTLKVINKIIEIPVTAASDSNSEDVDDLNTASSYKK